MTHWDEIGVGVDRYVTDTVGTATAHLSGQIDVLRSDLGKRDATISTLQARIKELEAQPVAPTTPPPTTDTAVLPFWGAPVWRDEFEGTAIDPAKWNVRDRTDLGLLRDAAIPDRNQITVADGVAHLKGDWLATPVARPTGQAGVTPLTHKTGYMDQLNRNTGNMLYEQRWGRWEIRCKPDTGPKTYGSLCAFWLRNRNSGEIDMMEAWGYDTGPAPGGQRIDTSTTTVFESTTTGAGKKAWTHADCGVSERVWDGFHVWAFELMPDYMAVYFDGRRIIRTTPAETPVLWGAQFQTPLHVRINLHIGPSPQYWGVPDPNNRQKTHQPLDYQIDYVRIYAPPK